MAQIKRLPPTLVNQIAAGEVVERPASVVKELLENAVDAGSKRIDVEVAQGGIDLIQVVDDGCGIPAEDLPLAFASHATSKLATVEDLFNIGTLGFRGEALASIGSIGQVKLQSRPAGQDCGAEITCHGGELGPVVPWNGSPGTRIEVRHLFFNTPARRKFLKGASTEMAHVSEAFTRLALAHYLLHWTLRHNNRPVYDVPTSLGMLDRIGLFFGADVRDALFLVEAEAGGLSVTGYVADPACDRGNAQLQYLFVNGRWVRDRALFQAVQDAYRGLLMTGRYPVAFMFVEVPPDAVDFNVHPTKAEVRFHDKDALYQLVQQAVRECLQKADLTARMQLHTKNALPPVAEPAKNVPSNPHKFVETGKDLAPESAPLVRAGRGQLDALNVAPEVIIGKAGPDHGSAGVPSYKGSEKTAALGSQAYRLPGAAVTELAAATAQPRLAMGHQHKLHAEAIRELSCLGLARGGIAHGRASLR